MRLTVLTKLQSSRSFQCVAVLVAGLLLAGFAAASILRGIASLLIVEDPLERAAAIVSLGGQTPFREIEAAKLYREGWAPRVIIVREASSLESEALQELGITRRHGWELSRAVLIQKGVPANAVVVVAGKGGGTLEELQAVYSAMTSKDAAIILVTSNYHTRRTRLTWNYVSAGRSQPIVRAATGDPFHPNHWWHRRSFVLSVVREYLGLVNYYARFAVAP
jgi:uncharacterized SAM-binding protein YcdF (DUF218 family)